MSELDKDSLVNMLERALSTPEYEGEQVELGEGWEVIATIFYRLGKNSAPQPAQGLCKREQAVLNRALMASVKIASAPQPEAQPQPDKDEAIRIWHKHCDPFASKLGDAPPSCVINAMLEFAAPSAQAEPKCTRSHPHENMNAECEALTIKAREDNAAAQKGSNSP